MTDRMETKNKSKSWKDTTTSTTSSHTRRKSSSSTSSTVPSYLLPLDSKVVIGDKVYGRDCDCCHHLTASYNNSKMGMMGGGITGGGASHSGSIMLALAAGTTLVSLLGLKSLTGMLDSSDDLEDEAQSDALEVAVIFCRVWMLSSAVVGIIAVRAILQSHIPSLRIFALHAIIDTLLAGLVVFIFALTAFSSSISQNLGHAVCEHLSRGDAWGLVSSPGSGLELCEERWNYGLAPFLLLLGSIGLFVRTKSAIFIYDYYRAVESGQGRISLESPSATSLLSSSSSGSSRSSHESRRMSTSLHDDHHHPHSHHHRGQQQPHHRSSSRPRTNTTTSNSAHSRSNSSSTVRPFRSATASRIMLLPVDYQSSSPNGPSPSLHITPPSPHLAHSNSSCESLDTVKGVSTTCSTNTTSNRKRAMSHDSGSNPYNHVVVYAPVLMSIEEAQQLGGKEAVIAASSSSASTSGMCASPTHYPASPRLRNVSPPENAHDHHRASSTKDVKNKPRRSDSESSNMTIVPDTKTPMGMNTATAATNPFVAIKGYRDATEMEELASAAKKA